MKNTVIFDVDGTLLDTERIYMEGWRQGGAILGYHVTEEALLKTRAVSKAVAIPIFQACCGADFPYDEVRAHRTRISEEIIAGSSPEQLCKPGAREVLEALRKKGYRIAVASSTKQEFTIAHLKQAGLMEYFQAVITGEMVEHGKPAPDIFLLAAERLGRKPEQCVVVGDTPADVFAGAEAGMDVYLIPDQVPANQETCVRSRRVLEHLGQLLPAMEELI